MDNAGKHAALPAVPQVCVPDVLDVAVAVRVDRRVVVVGESTQVSAQAVMDNKVVKESTL